MLWFQITKHTQFVNNFEQEFQGSGWNGLELRSISQSNIHEILFIKHILCIHSYIYMIKYKKLVVSVSHFREYFSINL